MATENYYIISKDGVFIVSRESPEVQKLIEKLREFGLEFEEEVVWCG